MELALIVWLIGIVKPLIFLFFAIGIITSLTLFFYCVDKGEIPKYRYFTIPVLFFFIASIIPSEKTGYMMVAAYATQKVAESSTAQEMSSDILRIVKAKVKEYADDSENKSKEKPVEKGAK